jgi:hypothetical protein
VVLVAEGAGELGPHLLVHVQLLHPRPICIHQTKAPGQAIRKASPKHEAEVPGGARSPHRCVRAAPRRSASRRPGARSSAPSPSVRRGRDRYGSSSFAAPPPPPPAAAAVAAPRASPLLDSARPPTACGSTRIGARWFPPRRGAEAGGAGRRRTGGASLFLSGGEMRRGEGRREERGTRRRCLFIIRPAVAVSAPRGESRAEPVVAH